MKATKLIFKLFLFSLVFVSCNNDDKIEFLDRDYSNGILISGEGSGAGSGSISYVSNDRSALYLSVYSNANGGVELGTFLQSLTLTDTKAYLIVDNANTITVVNKTSFVKEGSITTGLITPRYMTVVGTKGYVTNWGSTDSETDDFIAVVDLNTNTVEKEISVGNGPEQIIAKNGKLYVSHKGAFTYNNIVSVIDIATEDVTEITVEDKPDELFFNDAGELVVLSEGRTIYSADWTSVTGNTIGAIQTINVNTNTVTKSLEFVEGEHPSLMVLDNGNIYYYMSGKVYKMAANETVLPTTEILSETLSGMIVKNNELHGVYSSYTKQSDYNVFDLTTKESIYSAKVALGAVKIYFTE